MPEDHTMVTIEEPTEAPAEAKFKPRARTEVGKIYSHVDISDCLKERKRASSKATSVL